MEGNGSAGGDASTPLLGTLLEGRYRLDSEIARGGMATVFLATDTRLDRAVAVKVMHRALAEDPEFVARFTREAKASAKLSAAEVVAVHDYGTDRTTGLAYLVMEHVRGINLRQLVVERGALTPGRAVSLIEPVLRALAAAHVAGLVHRDIKPENVLLADDGRVKVADFGLARAVETSNLTQTTGLLIGTVAYLAPEHVESGTADARSDVYAAGVLLWELLTGSPPYSGDSPLSVAYKHVHEDMPPPSSLVTVPPALDDLVLRATRRDPAARPADGAAFLAELREVARGLPAVTAGAQVDHNTLIVPRPAPYVPKPREERPKRRGLIVTSLIVVLALLAVGGGYYLGSFRYTEAPGVLKLTKAEATAKLKSAGLTAKTGPEAFSEDIAVGQVLRQDPKAGGKVRKGGAVTLTLSKGPDRRNVPLVMNQTRAFAEKAIRDASLTVDPTQNLEFDERVAKGLVTRTDPPHRTTLKPGSPVKIFVSRGPQPVAVPNVVGKPQSEALALVRSRGFKDAVTKVFSDDVEAGKVISQSPAGGTAARGSTITLTVSKGPDVVEVPNVRGKKVDDAVRELQALGFRTDVQRAFPGGPRRVLDTDPNPGEKAQRGSTIVVKIY